MVKIKVLMCLMGLDIGGAETHVLELCRGLKKKDIDVYVASRGGVYVPELLECGIKHFTVPLHNKNLLNIVKSYKALKKIIKENKIDVVHAHARIPAFLCGLIAKKMKFAFVTTAHWIFNPSFPFNILTNWGSETLAVSDDIKKYLTENYALPPEQIRVTINGIDLEKFSPDTDYFDVLTEFNIDKNKRKIVYISRMDIDRSLAAHKLIECAPDILAAYPETQIIIVGGGNDFEQIKAEAEQMNEKLVHDAVILTGGRTDINKFIAMSDMFIGVSRAALEGMAAKKPTILAGNEGYIGIFDRDKLAASIDTNFCCRGCGQTETETLKHDILKLLGMDISSLSEMSEFSHETVRERYSIDRMSQDALFIYSKALKKRDEKRTTDVLISGYYGYRNSGDDALLQAIVGNLRDIEPDVNITVLSNNPKETSAVYNVNAIYRFNFLKIEGYLKRTKLLVSGGGSLIQDITSSKSLTYYLWIIQSAIRNGARTMLYSNGIGPLKQEKSHRRVTKILNQVDCITLRDENSLRELERLNVANPRICVTADPAFCLTPVEEDVVGNILSSYGVESGERYFVVSVRDWKLSDVNFEQKMADICDEICGRHGLTALFVAMQYPADSRICKAVTSKMRGKCAFADSSYTAQEILGIVQGAEFVVGMRLHTLIYSANVGVPVIGLVYDPKIKGLMECLGQPYHVDVLDIDTDKISKYADEIQANKEQISEKLRKISEDSREKAIETAKMAVNLLTLL